MAADCSDRVAAGHQGFAAAVAKIAPTVVNVIVIRARDDEDYEGYEFLPLSQAGRRPTGSGDGQRTTASGFIASGDGYVLTSAHAVRHAQQVWVVLADGRRLRADVVGLERRTDVALLKVGATGLPVARMAPEVVLCPGEAVAALGAPFGFGHSVTAGVVSANARALPGASTVPLIQTDVALNPGSSGGPLFDASGAVVGMNAMIFSASGIYVGVSFAVPIRRVLDTVGALRHSGRWERGHLGARSQAVTPLLAQAFSRGTLRGALIVQVDAGGPAATAGLREGDVVVAINGLPVANDEEFEDLVARYPGHSVGLEVWRRRATVQVMVRLGTTRPEFANPVAPALPAKETRLGLSLAPPAATSRMPAGVYVDRASGSALLAGVEAGDRITAVNAVMVSTVAEFDSALRAAEAQAGSVIALLVVRGQVMGYLPVTLQAR